jgi:hypothetical protein
MTTRRSTPEDPKGTPETEESAHTTADPAPEKPTAEDEGGGTIKYTGDAGVREITKAQWKGAGVEDQDTVVWDASNDYTLPLSKFSKDAVAVLGRDKGLKITEA